MRSKHIHILSTCVSLQGSSLDIRAHNHPPFRKKNSRYAAGRTVVDMKIEEDRISSLYRAAYRTLSQRLKDVPYIRLLKFVGWARFLEALKISFPHIEDLPFCLQTAKVDGTPGRITPHCGNAIRCRFHPLRMPEGTAFKSRGRELSLILVSGHDPPRIYPGRGQSAPLNHSNICKLKQRLATPGGLRRCPRLRLNFILFEKEKSEFRHRGVAGSLRVNTSSEPMRVIEVNMERRRNEGFGGGDREIPEKIRRPTASSGTILTCESPVIRSGIEPCSSWWEASVLIAQPPRPEVWFSLVKLSTEFLFGYVISRDNGLSQEKLLGFNALYIFPKVLFSYWPSRIYEAAIQFNWANEHSDTLKQEVCDRPEKNLAQAGALSELMNSTRHLFSPLVSLPKSCLRGKNATSQTPSELIARLPRISYGTVCIGTLHHQQAQTGHFNACLRTARTPSSVDNCFNTALSCETYRPIWDYHSRFAANSTMRRYWLLPLLQLVAPRVLVYGQLSFHSLFLGFPPPPSYSSHAPKFCNCRPIAIPTFHLGTWPLTSSPDGTYVCGNIKRHESSPMILMCGLKRKTFHKLSVFKGNITKVFLKKHTFIFKDNLGAVRMCPSGTSVKAKFNVSQFGANLAHEIIILYSPIDMEARNTSKLGHTSSSHPNTHTNRNPSDTTTQAQDPRIPSQTLTISVVASPGPPVSQHHTIDGGCGYFPRPVEHGALAPLPKFTSRSKQATFDHFHEIAGHEVKSYFPEATLHDSRKHYCLNSVLGSQLLFCSRADSTRQLEPRTRRADEDLDLSQCTRIYTAPHTLLETTPSQRPDLNADYTDDRRSIHNLRHYFQPAREILAHCVILCLNVGNTGARPNAVRAKYFVQQQTSGAAGCSCSQAAKLELTQPRYHRLGPRERVFMKMRPAVVGSGDKLTQVAGAGVRCSHSIKQFLHASTKGNMRRDSSWRDRFLTAAHYQSLYSVMCGRNAKQAIQLYCERYSNRTLISRKTIRTICKLLFSRSDLNTTTRVQRKAATGEKHQHDMLAHVDANPHMGPQGITRFVGISETSVLRILHQRKFHPHHMALHQELYEDDLQQRVQFCRFLLMSVRDDSSSLNNILFTDEAIITNHGRVNLRNMHYSAKENCDVNKDDRSWTVKIIDIEGSYVLLSFLYHFGLQGITAKAGSGLLEMCFFRRSHVEKEPAPKDISEIDSNRIICWKTFPVHEGKADNTAENQCRVRYVEHQRQWKVNMCCGIVGDYVTELYLFQYTMTCCMYAHFLRDLTLSQVLNETFPNWWLGHGGVVRWPVHSPDHTLLDFFLWGTLKDRVYNTVPTMPEDMQECIMATCRGIMPETL
ncbi:hypothetical protein PR048_000675 [Dryococelus australis]|uniref:Uncharacterized protein n=1 Tax=Dryococelus australis TaxID=614101 RepID=A0ABQ9IHM9_9NEOP|nr:hypothetical protein PR048_000675 [Dryococelus australis]